MRIKRKMVHFLYYLKCGMSRKEIADKFSVTLRTIYNWEHEMHEMMGEESTIKLMCLACRKGLFPKLEEHPLGEDEWELEEYPSGRKKRELEDAGIKDLDLIGEFDAVYDEW